MKSRKYVWIIAALALIVGWSLFHRSQTQPTQQLEHATNTVAVTNPVVQIVVSNSAVPLTPAAFGTNDSSTADIERRYRQGLIGKEQAIQEIYLNRNKLPQDFYGKVIDQFGQPITSVEITGELVFNTETYGGVRTETYTTQSDNEGLFQFTGLHGASFNVRLKKDGYKYGDRSEGFKGPAGNMMSLADRAILTMWKIRGAETLLQSTLNADLSPDGSPEIFDTTTGKQTPDGNLKITFLRVPSKIKPGLVHPYDWRFKIELYNGGLIQENDPYPYSAPDSGYQPSFEFEMSSNNVPWQNQYEQNFYVKDSNGKYGMMKFVIYSASTPPQAQMNFTINPSGSQNLEPVFSP